MTVIVGKVGALFTRNASFVRQCGIAGRELFGDRVIARRLFVQNLLERRRHNDRRCAIVLAIDRLQQRFSRRERS